MLTNLIRTATLAAALALPTLAPAQGVAPLDPPQSVKVAYVPIMKFATMYVAASRGLFEKYGKPPENQAWGDYMAIHIMAQAIRETKGTELQEPAAAPGGLVPLAHPGEACCG